AREGSSNVQCRIGTAPEAAAHADTSAAAVGETAATFRSGMRARTAPGDRAESLPRGGRGGRGILGLAGGARGGGRGRLARGPRFLLERRWRRWRRWRGDARLDRMDRLTLDPA